VQNSVVQPTTQIVASLLALGVGLSLVMVLGVIRPLYIQIQRLITRAGLAEFGLPRLALGALVALMLAVLTNYLAGASAAVAFATGFFIAFGLGLATAVRPDIDLLTAGLSAAVVGACIQLATISLLRRGSWTLALITGAGTGAMALIAAAVRVVEAAELTFPERVEQHIGDDLRRSVCVGSWSPSPTRLRIPTSSSAMFDCQLAAAAARSSSGSRDTMGRDQSGPLVR
jgi:hypothetical protein